MDEVPMSTVNLNSVHAGTGSANGRGTKGVDGFLDLFERKLAGDDVVVVPLEVCSTRGSDDVVAPKVGFGVVGVRRFGGSLI